MKDYLFYGSLILVGLIFTLFMLEVSSVSSKYALCNATIIKVEHGEQFKAWYHNQDSQTTIKFDDNYVTYITGDLGKVGDRVKVNRQIGEESFFGFANKTFYDMKNEKP